MSDEQKKSVLYIGSQCLTDINNAARAGHSAFTKAANGKIYFNFQLWLNAEPDNYGNHIGIKLNSTEEKQESDKALCKPYIGNAKLSARKDKPVDASDIPNEDDFF